MKLPGAIKTGVRGLAQMPNTALADHQNTMNVLGAVEGAIGVAGAEADAFEEQRQSDERRSFLLGVSDAENEYNLEFGGKDVVSAKDIPEGSEVRRTNKEVINGEMVETEREDIPAYEVSAEIYRDRMTKNAKAQASKITNKEQREQLLEDAMLEIDSRYANEVKNSRVKQREYTAKKLDAEITLARESGSYDDALILANEIKSPDKKATVKKTIRAEKQEVDNDGYFQNIESYGNHSAVMAREGDKEGSNRAKNQAFKNVYKLVDSGALTEAQADKIVREIDRESDEQLSRKEFQDVITDEGVEAADTKLQSIKGKPIEGWTPDEWDTYTNSQQADINREKSRLNALKQKETKEGAIALKQYSDAVSLGFEVEPSEKLRVKELVAGTDNQKVFDRINKVSAFSLLPISERQDQLGQASNGKLGGVDDFAAMLKANNEINKLASKDGYSLAVNQGLIEPITLDPSNPMTLMLKADQAETLSLHYGVRVSPLTDGEASQISSSIDSMSVNDKVVLANTLNEAPEVWGQISSKNQQAFSMAGATGDNDLMANVFKGQELLKNKLVSAPKAMDYLKVSDEFLGDVYGVQDKAAILESAKAHYAATIGNVDVFDVDGFEESLSAVTGGIGEINGNKIELPRGIDEDDFDDFIDGFSVEQVKALGGVQGYTDAQAANVIQNGILKSVGSNKYISMTNGNQGLFKTNGEPLIIEFTEEAQAQQEAVKFTKSRSIESSINKLRSF